MFSDMPDETPTLKKDDDHDMAYNKGATQPENFDFPVRITCPHCNRVVVTCVEQRHNWISVGLFFILIFCLSFFGICLYPFISRLFKDTIHSCPRCRSVIMQRKRVHLPVISNEIVTMQCGSCAIVLSKAYLIAVSGIIALICMMSGIRWYLRTVGLPDLDEGPLIPNSWDDFVANCGYRSSLGHPLRAHSQFEKVYYGNSVLWEGRLNRVSEGMFHKSFVYINMTPHQAARPEVADLALIFNMHKLGETIADLNIGDRIAFKATLLELSRRGSPHLGFLWEANRTAKAEDLPDMYEESRTSFYIKPPIAHLPRLAHKLADVRRDFVEQRLQDVRNGNAAGFMFGDEFVGLPPHLVKNALLENQKASPRKNEIVNNEITVPVIQDSNSKENNKPEIPVQADPEIREPARLL